MTLNLAKIYRAKKLFISWVTFKHGFFTDDNWNFDESTIFEVLTWDWNGRVLVARAYDIKNMLEDKPCVAWMWVDVDMVTEIK